jgi:hypothetical protein
MKCSPAPEQHSQPSRTSVFHTEFINLGLLTLMAAPILGLAISAVFQ